jgi:hypothetical protein
MSPLAKPEQGHRYWDTFLFHTLEDSPFQAHQGWLGHSILALVPGWCAAARFLIPHQVPYLVL